MKSAYGLCLLCEKNLMSECASCGHKKPSNEYCEVTMKLSNNSLMPVAVCHTCKDAIWHADKLEIMKAVRAGWHQEHEKMHWNKELRERYWASHGEGILEIVDA